MESNLVGNEENDTYEAKGDVVVILTYTHKK